MNQAECPKCGQPREAEAVECPWCSVIYARFRGGPPPPPLPTEAVPPQPPAAAPAPFVESTPPTVALPELYGDAPAGGDVYPGEVHQPPSPGSAPPGHAPAAHAAGSHPVEKVDTVLTRNMLLALLVSGLLAVFAQGFWNQEMLNGSVLAEEARDRYLTLAGFEAPADLDDGAALKLAGRELVWLARADAPPGEPTLVAVAFRPGSLAGRMDRLDLLDGVERLMNRAELPFDEIANRKTTIGGAAGLSRTYGFGDAPFRLFSLALETPSGDRSLVVLFGPTSEVHEASRRWLR
jgi:hypothetical protein